MSENCSKSYFEANLRFQQDTESFIETWYDIEDEEEDTKESEETKKDINQDEHIRLCFNEIQNLKKTPLSSVNIEDEEKSEVKIEHWYNVARKIDYTRSKGFLPQSNDENENEKDVKICFNNKTVLGIALSKILGDLFKLGIRQLLKSKN